MISDSNEKRKLESFIGRLTELDAESELGHVPTYFQEFSAERSRVVTSNYTSAEAETHTINFLTFLTTVGSAKVCDNIVQQAVPVQELYEPQDSTIAALRASMADVDKSTPTGLFPYPPSSLVCLSCPVALGRTSTPLWTKRLLPVPRTTPCSTRCSLLRVNRVF